MLLLFYALPPMTAYPDEPSVTVARAVDDDEEELILLAYFEYFV